MTEYIVYQTTYVRTCIHLGIGVYCNTFICILSMKLDLSMNNFRMGYSVVP